MEKLILFAKHFQSYKILLFPTFRPTWALFLMIILACLVVAIHLCYDIIIKMTNNAQVQVGPVLAGQEAAAIMIPQEDYHDELVDLRGFFCILAVTVFGVIAMYLENIFHIQDTLVLRYLYVIKDFLPIYLITCVLPSIFYCANHDLRSFIRKQFSITGQE